MKRVKKSNMLSVSHVEGYIRNIRLVRKHNITSYSICLSQSNFKIFIRGRIWYYDTHVNDLKDLKRNVNMIIKWLIAYCWTSCQLEYHSNRSPLPMKGCDICVDGLWTQRGLSCDIPIMTQELGFQGIMLRIAPFCPYYDKQCPYSNWRKSL